MVEVSYSFSVGGHDVTINRPAAEALWQELGEALGVNQPTMDSAFADELLARLTAYEPDDLEEDEADMRPTAPPVRMTVEEAERKLAAQQVASQAPRSGMPKGWRGSSAIGTGHPSGG